MNTASDRAHSRELWVRANVHIAPFSEHQRFILSYFNENCAHVADCAAASSVFYFALRLDLGGHFERFKLKICKPFRKSPKGKEYHPDDDEHGGETGLGRL